MNVLAGLAEQHRDRMSLKDQKAAATEAPEPEDQTHHWPYWRLNHCNGEGLVRLLVLGLQG